MGLTSSRVFVMLTFAISWGAWLPLAALGIENRPIFLIGAFGPTLAALLISASTSSLSDLLRPMLKWRVGIGSYVFAFGATAVVCFAALLLDRALGGTNTSLFLEMPWYAPPLIFTYVLVFSVMGEEIGWRGFLLPRLLSVTTPNISSLGVGLIWAVWHLPLFFMAENFHNAIPIPLFMAQVVGFSFLYTWLWLGTKGSLLLAHLFHAASNTTLGIFAILPTSTTQTPRALYIAVAGLGCLALLSAIRMGSRAGRS